MKILVYNPFWDFWCLRAPRWRNIHLITFFQKSYKLSICSFLEYCCTIVFMEGILRPLKGCALKCVLVRDRKVQKVFSALKTKGCIKSFTCNNTSSSLPFLNEILFLHYVHVIFIRPIFLRKCASKIPRPSENVKKISSLKCVRSNF